MSKAGYISPSQFGRIMVAADVKKGTFGTGAMTYAYELACQRHGVRMPEAFGAALDWGIDNEWAAKREYEHRTFATVLDVTDPIEWPLCKWVRGYPDGLIGQEGLIEAKCPFNPVHHFRNLECAAQYESDYKDQVQGYLLLTGRKWCDFVSFDPRWPDDKRIAIKRIEPDKEYLSLLSERLLRFADIVDNLAESI